MRFEWDPEKCRRNRSKHGVSFEKAAELLAGESDCLDTYDEEHSLDEDRFVAIGPGRKGYIVIVYTERAGSTVRIPSARKATRKEARQFELHRGGFRE